MFLSWFCDIVFLCHFKFYNHLAVGERVVCFALLCSCCRVAFVMFFPCQQGGIFGTWLHFFEQLTRLVLKFVLRTASVCHATEHCCGKILSIISAWSNVG